MSGDMLTVPEVAAHLRVSQRTVWRLIEQRRLRPVRIGRRVVISARELQAFVAAQERRVA